MLTSLERLLRASTVLTGVQAAPYLRDASSAEPGMALGVVLAGSAADVATAVAWAHAQRIPVVPRGAGTGLSGGASALPGGLVISTERMDRIIELRPADRLAVVEPGVVVDDLDAAAGQEGLMYAPDPASSATATVGGTIATNAGGLRCLRHGVTADSISALQVVLADGRLLRTGAASRKNVAGYDLTRLFVGSEGTLGVITEATVRLLPIPEGERVTFQVAFPTTAAAGKAVAAVMASPITPDILELIDGTTAGIIESYSPSGLSTAAAATLVGQIVDPHARRLIDRLQRLFTDADGYDFRASSDDALLVGRRNAFPALAARGMGVSWLASDAAVPPSRLPELLDEIKLLEASHKRLISVVAHAGDGNIHAAVSADLQNPADVEVGERVVELIAAQAVRLGGTVTGEHGIGSLKRHLLTWALDDTSRDVHQKIKEALDPLGILNPGRGI
jgi:glycolate oxidase